MPWKDNSGSGGPWGNAGGSGGNKTRGPWGGSGGNNGSNGRGGPPKFGDMLRQGGDRMKGMMPGGLGSPRGVAIIVLVALIVWLGTGVYRVNPNEAGVEQVFGRLTNVTNEGLHWNWPSPIGSVTKPATTINRQTTIGFPTAGRGQSRDQDGLMLTGDENIIDIQATILWNLDYEPRPGRTAAETAAGIRNYVFNIRRPDQTVKDAAEAAIREIVGRRDFEVIRTSGRAEIEREAAKQIQEILDLYGAGIRIRVVQLQKVDPPSRVIDAFRDVQAARADRERAISEAKAYQSREEQQAEGQAKRIEAAGEAYKAERIAIAEGESRRFLAVFDQYKGAKDITRQRIYLETMRDLLKSMDKTLIDTNRSNGVVPWLSLDRDRPPPARVQSGERPTGGQQ